MKRTFWPVALAAALLLALFTGLATADHFDHADHRIPTTTTIVCPVSVTYTGLAQTPCTASVTGPGLNKTLQVWYFRDNTDAGVVVARAWFAGNRTYRPSEDFGRFVITKATSTTKVECRPVTYTGSPVTPCWAWVKGVGGLRLLVWPTSLTYRHNVNAGYLTAEARYRFKGDRNHTGSMDSTWFTISKAPSVTTVTCTLPSPTYTGLPLTPCSVTVTGAGGLSLTPLPIYKHNTNAGFKTAWASYTYKGDRNHTGSSDSTKFTILKATSMTTVMCPSTSQTYTGLALKPCTATVTGASLTLNKTAYLIYANNTNVGTTPASASYTYAGDLNHTGSSGSATFTIAKADQAALVITNPGPVASGTSGVVLATTGGSTGNPVAWALVPGGTAANCAINSTTGSFSDVGGSPADSGKTCIVQATMPGNSNYNIVNSAPVTITLT